MGGQAQLGTQIRAALPLVEKLSLSQQKRLNRLVRQFLHDVEFRDACAKDPTPEAPLKVASHACLLLLNRQQDRFHIGLRIVIHANGIDPRPGGKARQFRWGHMDIDWAEIRQDGATSAACITRVMHEFAHRLDSHNMRANSTPALLSTQCHATWAKVMEEERDVLCARLDYGVPTPIDPAAATSHAEFFACTTEAYFEQPDMLRDHFPRVYAQLAHFYEDGAQAFPTSLSFENPLYPHT